MQTSEYLVELKKLLTFDIRETVKSGADVSEGYLVNKAYNYLERLVLGEHISRVRLFNRRTKDQTDLEETWNMIKEDVQKHIADTIKNCRSKKMVTEIRQITAQTQITEAMNATGLKYQILLQTYRAKVAVKLSETNKVIFYVSYKRTAEDLDRCIPAAKSLIELVERLGKCAAIQKIMPYENWWQEH